MRAAVADLGRFHISGFAEWFSWLAIDIFFLIGFRNRLRMILQQAWAYLTCQRGAIDHGLGFPRPLEPMLILDPLRVVSHVFNQSCVLR